MTFVWILVSCGMLVTLVPIMTDRSRHRPGNVAPVQLISTIGVCALLLLQEAMLVTSIRDGSLIVACASFATLLTAIILFLRGDGSRVVSDQVPETIDAMVREIEQILGDEHRTGIESVKAVIVDGSNSFIGVSVPRRGHIVVRIRKDLLPWLERHRGPGGAGSAAAGSLLRFTFLHELGHVLNGDHLSYRFVRSVLVAHLWWLMAAFGGTGALVTSLCLAPPFLAQRLLARRFLAAREEDADLRAMQTLEPVDARLLTTRKPEGGGSTLLEKLMTDLHVQTSIARPAIRPLSQAIRWIWPEAGRIHERSELVVDGRGGRTAEPSRWAGWMGLQCGLLSISILTAFGTAFHVVAMVIALICSMAATYCGIRVAPDLLRLHNLSKAPLRWAVAMIFYLSFSASVLLLYLLPAFSSTLPYSSLSLVIAASILQVIFGSLMGMATAGGGVAYAASPLRHPMLRKAPATLISIVVVAACSLTAGRYFGVKWPGPALLTWAAVITSFNSSRSTNAVVRAIAPFALLDSAGNVFGIRIFWRELYFERDLMPSARIEILALSTYTTAALFCACGTAFAAKVITVAAGEEAVFQCLLLVSTFLVGLEMLVPKYAGRSAHLFEHEHLVLFHRLLVTTRTARLPGAVELSEALALWVRSETALPQATLPGPRSIWKLESLLLLKDIARRVDAGETAAKWRGPTVDALRRILSDGAVSLNGRQPSLVYTVMAAQVIDDAGLSSEIPIEPILDSIADQLEQWLNGRRDASMQAVFIACQLLETHGRSRPGPDRIRMRSLVAFESALRRPIRGSVGELAHYTALLRDTVVQEHLTNIVRSRLWETLQLNPSNDVFLLLDGYDAAVLLGEQDSPLLAVAKSAIGVIAERMADELMKVCRGMQDVTSSRSVA